MLIAVELYENKMQVDFCLTFIVGTMVKQDAKTGLVEVVKQVVWLSSGHSASKIWDFSRVQG